MGVSASFFTAHSTPNPVAKFDPVEWEEFSAVLTSRPVRGWRKIHDAYAFLRGVSSFSAYEDRLWRSEGDLRFAISSATSAARKARDAAKALRRAVSVFW